MHSTRGGARKQPPASPALSLEGQGLSMDSFAGAAGGAASPAAGALSMRSFAPAGVASGRFSPTRPLSPVQDGDSLAQEVEHELKFQGDLAKQNRDRVEAMRAQLRKFQQLTATNAKEIKTLRAERFKLLQNEADIVNASLEEDLMQQEEEAREHFAKKTFVVPHQDLPDVGGGAKGGVDSETAKRTADSEERVKDELYPASDPDSDVESICGHRGMIELAALTAREEAAFLKVKTYRGSLFGPDNEDRMQFERESHLQPVLQRVAGCSVRGRNSNVFWLASRRVVYTSGSIAVVAEWQAESTVEQDFFTLHAEEISAMCVHPNGTTVATGEEAAEPTIYVWDSNEMEVLSPAIAGLHTRGIASLAFSKDGMLLFSVGRDTSQCIAAHDWRTGQLICSERADTRRRVVGMRCNPHDGLLVTVGVRHIKFWTLSLAMGTEALASAPPISVWQQKLEPKRGVFGRHGVSKSHTLLCVEFGGPGVTITGSRDGSLLIWKGVALVSWLQAHMGPVFSLWAIPALGQTKLCSGGKDGAVGLWMFDSSLHLLYKPIALPKEPKEKKTPCIRSVCWHETMGEIVLATADSKILLLSPDPERFTEPPRLLQRGHRRSPVRALAAHPDGGTFVTGGADGQLLLWDSETGFVVGECSLPHGITYACYHKDGNKIAVCMQVGGGILISQTPQRKLAPTSYRFCEQVKCEITLAKFSPDSDMLVVGYRSKLEILNADSLKSKIGSLVGHEGHVMHVDWSTDGKYLVSTSDTYELLFWDRFTGKPILASSVANFAKPGHETTWATWTCNLGWAIQGISAAAPDEFFITSVARDSSSTLMLTGDANGGVSLSPYPCPGTFYPVSPPRLHVGPVVQALFLGRPDDPSEGAKENSRIVSLGSADGNILIWRLEKAVPRVDVVEEEDFDEDTGQLAPDVERLVQESRAKPRVLEDVVTGGVVDEFEAVKPYLMSVCPPTSKVVPPEVFEWRLQLQYLHGFQGSYGRASAFVAKSGEILYAAGASCVLQVPDSLVTDESKRISPQIQRHFTQHTDHIHCMACHPHGHVVASSDGQPNGTILVWEVHSLEVVARLPADDESNAALLAFSNDGSMLVSVSNESLHAVSVWDWRAQQLLVREDGDYEASNRILSVAVDPLGAAAGRDWATTFITCGVNHVKFWTLERENRGGYRLRSQRGLTQDEEASRIHLCARGTLDANFVTGTDKGELLLWKGVGVVHTVAAHSGPVFALAENRENHHLCSGSNDCCIKVWSTTGFLQIQRVIELRGHLDNTFLDPSASNNSLGLRWEKLGSQEPLTGTEISNDALAVGLREKLEFSEKEWDKFKVSNLCSDSYIRSGDKYFRPASVRGPSIRTLDWNVNRSLDRVVVGTAAGEVFHLFKKDGEECIEFLANGHGAGQIRALSSHPSQLLVASGGEDKTIRIWELGDEPTLYRVLTTKSIVTALEFSPGEGTLLAVGHDSGSIRILDMSSIVEERRQSSSGHETVPVPYDSLFASAQPASKRKVAIEVLRFSPDGCYLASGCPDSVIDLFSVNEGFEQLGTCKGHTGAISQLDFDSSSSHLQSNTWSDELKFWDIPSCAETHRAVDLCDSEWATFTCRLAWHVLACVPTGNESSVRSISRQHGKDPSVFAVGYGSGQLKLMPFPAPEPEFTGISLQSSCRAINHVCYSHDDSFLIVAGGPDPVIEIYRHYEVQQIPSDDSDVCEIVNSRRPRPSSHAHAASEESQMSCVKPYLGAVFAPTTEPFICPASALPNFKLSLEHVQSFRGHDTRHSLFFTASGAIAFMACGMIVIQEGNETRETPRQRHFCEHKGELTCASLHPDGTIIASAERGPNPVILVWDSSDFDETRQKFTLKASLAGLLVLGKMKADSVGISHVCFGGPDVKWLFALGLSEESVLSVYDWEKSLLLSHVSVRQSKILDVACNPVDHSLVTCGVKHLKFWSVKNGGAKIVSESAFYGERVVPRTMCSVGFLALGAYSLAVTGSIDGCLFLWKKEQLLHVVKEAHSGSIFDLAFDRANFLFYSAGRDGAVRVWSVDDHSGMLSPKLSQEQSPVIQSVWCARCGFYVAAAEGGTDCPNCKQRKLESVPHGTACIRSISVKGQQVVAGTSRGELALIVPASASASIAAPEASGAPKELRLLLSSHGKGAVSAIEFHPLDPSLFFTVGDDCLLRMWHLQEKRLLLCIRLASVLLQEDGKVPTGVTATGLHVSRDGRFVAVGFSHGKLALLDCVTSERRLLLKHVSDDDEFRVLRRGEGVSCLRFGTHNKRILLAAGTCDGLIHLFQDDEGRHFSFATTCKGHSGKILSIDWSLDGNNMQSTSEDYQLLFWQLEVHTTDPKDIPESVSVTERDRMLRPRLRGKPQRPIKCCDVEWSEWTSSLGWWVQGSRKIAADENAIVSTHAPHNTSLCVFGDVDGQVSLLPFPCSEKSPVLAQARIQTGPIRCVRLSTGEQDFLLGASEREGGLFTWRIEAKGKDDLAKMAAGSADSDPCWQLVMHRLTEVHSSVADGAEKQGPQSSQADDNFLASVHPYLSAIRPPLGWRPSSEAFKTPDNELKLEYVFGYRGLDCARNLLKLKNQELLYYVASVCVILNPHNHRRTQRIFDKHRSDIECVALNPDRITIASVSAGIRPKVQVWNSKSMKVLGHVDSLHEGKLCAMCFSGDGKVLALVVTNGETCSVAFYDWRHNTLLAERTAQPWTILAMECNPVTGTFVTAGVRHVYFWRLIGRNLSVQMGLVEQHQTMTNIAFLGENDRSNTIVLGNTAGDLLLWKEDKESFSSLAPDQLVKKAHPGGPVFDMKNDDGRLITCSKGGHVSIWKHEGRCAILKEHDLFITLPSESSECSCCEKSARDKMACIRSVVRIKKLDMGTYSLVIGTGNNSIYEAYIDASSTTLHAEVIMPSHSEGKIVGLVSHPGKPIFASCGEDRSVKVWDREERIILRERCLPHEPSTLAYTLDGSRLVVGTNTGNILILSASTLEDMAGVDRPATRKVRDLKFSPDGRLLAAASEDAIIYVYAIPLTRQYIVGEPARESDARDTFRLVGMCKGHARGVVRLDWSSDGAQLQSESDDYDTILWDMGVCDNLRYAPMRNAQSHVSVPWQTRDCILTWHTFGLLHPVADFNTFLTSSRSKLGDALAVGDCNGGLRLYRFPCPSKENRFRHYSGHSTGVSKVCFSYEDRHLMSAGCRDQAVFVWHHLIIPGPEETDAIIEEMIRNKKHDHAAVAAAQVLLPTARDCSPLPVTAPHCS